MSLNFSVDIQMQLTDTLCSVFYYKRPLIEFMKRMELPKPLLEKLEISLREVPKRSALYDLLNDLLALPDNEGTGPINRIVQKLSTWSNFSSSDNSQKAAGDVKQLASMLDASSRKREALAKEKEQRELDFAKRQASSNRMTQQDQLKAQYVVLMGATNPQKRGLEFERRFLQDVFQFEGIKSTESFVLAGEQIDGAIEFETEHYLVECKWIRTRVSPEQVSWFKTKLERKLSGTRGLMVSINGFTDEAVRTAAESRCIILMDGDDLYHTLENSTGMTFRDLFQRKISEFAQKGNPYITARSILSKS